MATTTIEFAMLVPQHPDYHRAVGSALDFAPPYENSVRNFCAEAARRGQTVDLVYAAYASDGLMGAVVGIESPGRAVLVLSCSPVQGLSHTRDWVPTAAELLRMLSARAMEGGAALLEMLVPVDNDCLAQAAAQSGFRRLTRLAYLTREAGNEPPFIRHAPTLQWQTLTPRNESVFVDTLASSYAQSMDCPELNGLRSPRDVLDGHRATGDHDPALWFLASAGDTPVGVLFLTRLPDRSVLELVYMGVAQPARGKGVGNALLARALLAARRESVTMLALAVDVRNVFARSLYHRWGFRIQGFRDAWIATPEAARS